MADRKYKVTVFRSINCSSSGHYHCEVAIDSVGTGKRDTRWLDFNGMGLLYHNGMGWYQGYPKYVDVMIITQLFSMLENGELEVYEYDRDRNKRYENLRYHDVDHLRHIITFYYDKMLPAEKDSE